MWHSLLLMSSISGMPQAVIWAINFVKLRESAHTQQVAEGQGQGLTRRVHQPYRLGCLTFLFLTSVDPCIMCFLHGYVSWHISALQVKTFVEPGFVLTACKQRAPQVGVSKFDGLKQP